MHLFKTEVSASTYYVDQTGGSDSNSGTATDQAWKTINKVNTSSFNPGDTISFKKGEIWREQLTVPSSGSSGSPITFNSYGTGAKPQILGSAVFSTAAGSSWNQTSASPQTGDIWNETFEGPGFTGGPYTESLGAGSTFTPNSQAISPPTDGGSYVAYVDKVSPNYNAREKKDLGTAYGTFYARAHVYVTDLSSLAVNGAYAFFEVDDAEFGNPAIMFYASKIDNSSYRISLRTYYDGAAKFPGSYTAAINTWYKVEAKYDTTAGTYEFRINGTIVLSGSLTGTTTTGRWVKMGSNDSADWTFYLDRLAINSTGYLADTVTLPANSWKAALTDLPKEVWFLDADGTTHWGSKTANLASLAALYDWYADGYYLYVYTTDGSGPNNAWGSLEASQRDFGVGASADNTKQYITVNGLDARYTEKYGIRTGQGSPGWQILNNDISYISLKNNAYADGIYVQAGSATISGNVIHDTGTHGIYVVANDAADSIQNVTVENNTIYDAYHTGIDVMNLIGTLSNIIVRGNLYYNTSGFDTTYTARGIFLSAENSNVLDNVDVYNNVVYNYCDTGISVGGSTGTETNIDIYNNTVYEKLSTCTAGNWSYIIKNTLSTAGGAVNNFKNNIAVQTNNTAGSQPINIQDSSKLSSFDYNLYYRLGGTGTTTASANDTGYSSLATYQAAVSPNEAHSLFADPLVVNATTFNFNLQSTSPAVNAGVDLSSVLTDDYADISRPQGIAYDIGAYEYVASTPVVSVSSGTTGSASSSSVCSDQSPGSVSDLFQAEMTSTKAKLFIAPGQGPYDRFFVSYGNDLSASTHAAIFSQSYTGGAISYTVGSLDPRQAWYFKVRAGNGCAFGPWSNTLKTFTTSSSLQTKTYYKNVFTSKPTSSKARVSKPVPKPTPTPPPTRPPNEPEQTTTTISPPSMDETPISKPKTCFLWIFCW